MYLYFLATVIVGINFKHSLNSESKPPEAIIVDGNFRYLLVYIDHHLCRLSYKLTRCTRGDARSFFLYSQNVCVCTKRNSL